MSKRNIRAKSGKQLYLNSSFNKGMVYTSSEIPEGYTKLLNNFDITPSGDAISPRAPFKEIKHKVQGLSKYTYPINFQQIPNKQFYINFPYTITEEEYNTNHMQLDYNSVCGKSQINLFSRDSNMLNNNALGFDTNVNVIYTSDNYIELELTDNNIILKDFVSGNLYTTHTNVEIPVFDFDIGSPDYLTTYSVIDADTVYINGTKYRLLNINAPEKNYKWYSYGKHVLEQLLSKATYGYFHINEYGTDIYGRKVSDVFIYIDNSKWISLSQAVIRLGLAKLDYVDESYEHMDIIRHMEELAIEDDLRIWSINAIDILYNGRSVDIVFSNVEDGDYVLEAVKIVSEKQINYNTTNRIDYVDHIYVDYNDSIAFIGRVVEVGETPSIYYKGLIYFKYDSDTNRFLIELPPNNLNGEEVKVLDITANGYNLLNKEVIDTDDYTNDSVPLSCDGIVVTLPNDPTTLVQQAKPGSTVLLRAIMNRSWYTVPTIEDNAITNICVKINHSLRYTELNNDNYISYTENYISNNTEIHRIRVDENATDITRITLDVRDITLEYRYNDIQYTNIIQIDKTFNIMQDSAVSILTYDISTILPGAVGVIEFNYVSDIGIRYIYAKLPSIKVTPTITQPTIQGRWEVTSYTSDVSRILQDFTDICVVNGEVPNEWNDVNTLEYNVTELNDLIFTFKYRLHYSVQVGDTVLESIGETDYTPVVYPRLSVGELAKYINHEELTKNLNIEDATRLGVFNRQVFVYGPYLKTNTIFFSKFENPWYFSYPYYSIDTEDKIIYAVPWNSNLTIFQKNSIWVLVTEGTVNESTLHKVYDELSISDIDRRLVKTVGSNLIFFNNNNGYMMTSSKYYNDPTNVSVYKFTDNINNCLLNPTYIFRTVRSIPLNIPTNHIYCEYFLYIDNDYINLASYIVSNNGPDKYSTSIIYRYSQLYKNWTTYSVNKYLTYAYTTEPNINNQYITYDGSQFGLLYQNYNDISRSSVDCIIDTGFLSIDPLNDKRFKDVILDFNNIVNCQKSNNNIDRNDISIYHNFFIDGIPHTLSDNNPAIDFEYENKDTPISVPKYDEGNYSFKFVDEVDYHNNRELPFGYVIQEWSKINTNPDNNSDNGTKKSPNILESSYTLKVQGRSQIRLPVFGKGRLPSMAIKINSKYPYDIVGYSIIYKEKNINRRR